MTDSGGILKPERPGGKTGPKPRLRVVRIGIVSRDYRHKYENELRDFSEVFPRVLRLLDEQRCDTVLFSLFSIIQRPSFRPMGHLRNLRHVRSVLYEEFTGRSFVKGKWKEKTATKAEGWCVVLHRQGKNWETYKLRQIFGSLSKMKEGEIRSFVSNEIPKRILGNCCVILCGESNGVNFSRADMKVHDHFHFRKAIPPEASIILNPIHDRMTRPEMRLKRAFLSRKGRWVISVWNKGKVDKNGRVTDGKRPPWTVFHDGNEKKIDPMRNQLGLEIGILNVLER